MLSDAIISAFKKKEERKWERLYWMIDVHDTMFPGEYREGQGYSLGPEAVEVLQWLSNRPDMWTILWTSSYPAEYFKVTSWLWDEYGIDINFFNENPDCKNTDLADFSKKPYFNIILDDKAGFMPSDWKVIKDTLIKLGEW